jgi:hypothetical protein
LVHPRLRRKEGGRYRDDMAQCGSQSVDRYGKIISSGRKDTPFNKVKYLPVFFPIKLSWE